jgi:flavin reductase (DIM6/NTAB) family NADH-FMN oxidoreductase RutF
MYYDPRQNSHSLPHDPFLALVVPRPIGWISTLDRSGNVNLAPYSFFNALSTKPPFVMFSSSARKDSQRNAEAMGEFVVNVATYDLREEVNATSVPADPGVDEAALVGLEMIASVAVRPPRVARSPVALECLYLRSVPMVSSNGVVHSATIVIGEVIGVHIDDAVITDGRVDVRRMRPLSRLGYLDYGIIDTVFSLPRPKKAVSNGGAA